MHIKSNIYLQLSSSAQLLVKALTFSTFINLNCLITILSSNAPKEYKNIAVIEYIKLENSLQKKSQTFKFNNTVSKVLTIGNIKQNNIKNCKNRQSLHLCTAFSFKHQCCSIIIQAKELKLRINSCRKYSSIIYNSTQAYRRKQ